MSIFNDLKKQPATISTISYWHFHYCVLFFINKINSISVAKREQSRLATPCDRASFRPPESMKINVWLFSVLLRNLFRRDGWITEESSVFMVRPREDDYNKNKHRQLMFGFIAFQMDNFSVIAAMKYSHLMFEYNCS